MLKHNKKRNIGLLSEFFAKYMANAAVEFRYGDIDRAKAIWRNHVANNKLLSQELQLFEALYKTHIKNGNVANKLLEKVKTVAERQNQAKLDEAKTRMLHEINSTLNDDEFFNRPVDDFRTFATIQVLLNSWRNEKNSSKNFTYVSRLEDQILEHINSEKKPLPPLDPSLLSQTKEDIDRLVVNVFREKVDAKYSEVLNEDQKKLLGWYIFASNQEEAKENLTNKLLEIKKTTLINIDKEFKSGGQKNATVEKLKEAKEYLVSDTYDVHSPNDRTMSFYLAVCALNKELETEQ